MPPLFGAPDLQGVGLSHIVEDTKAIILASTLQASTTKSSFERATALLVASTAEDDTLRSPFGNAEATVASFLKELNLCSFLENIASASPSTIRTNIVARSTLGTTREHVTANVPQDISPEAVLKTIKAFFRKLADALGGLLDTVDWPAMRARVRYFVDTAWIFIENNRLLSQQKSAGYGLLLLCCCPQSIMTVLMLPVTISATVIHLVGLVILNLLGFALEGVRAFSLAASFQANTYGAITPAGSTFSRFQSMGARGFSAFRAGDVSSVAIVLRFVAGSLGIYLIIDDFLRQSAQ